MSSDGCGAAIRRAREILSEEGDRRDIGEDSAAARAVSAVVPSGFWTMNPALVTVAVAPREQAPVSGSAPTASRD
jgi:hypothetical protein